MKNKILLAIVIILSFICIGVIRLKKESNHSFSNEKNIKVKDINNNIKNLNIEEYLIGVIAAEMPASFEIEALKAQAVAARTYAYYKIKNSKNQDYNILTTITDQSYIDKEEMQEKWQESFNKYYEKIKKAVDDTKDEVLFYNNEIIEAFYFSMSNGKTENSSSVFKENLPYLTSVNSKWDNEKLNNFLVETNFLKKDFCEKLTLDDCDSIKIENIIKSESNRILSLNINNKIFLGTDIRKLLNLRSTDFTIEVLENNILITTKGYGHGVGMSQYGANGMAKEGAKYQDILNYYYKDVTLNKLV